MTALDQYVNQIKTAASGQGSVRLVLENIERFGELLSRHTSLHDQAISQLDNQPHALGIFGILRVKYQAVNIGDWELLYQQTVDAIHGCLPLHAQQAIELYIEVCHQFTNTLVKRKQFIRGIAIIKVAIKKLQNQPSQLTSLHSDVCQLCLLSKCLNPALELLNEDVNDIIKEGQFFDSLYLLQYFYYGGMIYASLKNYERAIYFFQVAVMTPSTVVSHVMLEAYKKHTLISLIHLGKVPPFPKYTSQIVSRYIVPLCQPYQELASVYGNNNPSNLNSVIAKHADIFNRETNMGLVKQCVISMYKQNIQRLTKTFITLSLSDMAQRVHLSGPEEAEKYMIAMIADGDIHATINQKDGMVKFHDKSEDLNATKLLCKLEAQMTACMNVHDQLRLMDLNISKNQIYIQKMSATHDDELVSGSSSAKFGATVTV